MSNIRVLKVAESLKQILRFMTDHGKMISIWRGRVAANDATLYDEANQASLTASARKALGLMRQAFEYSQTAPAAFDAAVLMMGLDKTELTNDFISYRNAFRAFRNASKTNSTQATAALNALESAIPTADAVTDPMPPTDW